ncbi:beta-N-acetylhexosaminidase [Amycolatopsis xylanica]|uniref:beta-N-acetylhexosaminidase n=1 Tax=Amycolatopsis xylanica TaxID=589385 RepID=A0A1H3K939_9PSEU|nr:glycoside hydrolase family 3 N-terminal domain-containing protein [Amycolatopsis xylanica]SDY48707.1 beta-N-acetylhexosaminidase [Amycolatopsis xylanica]
MRRTGLLGLVTLAVVLTGCATPAPPSPASAPIAQVPPSTTGSVPAPEPTPSVEAAPAGCEKVIADLPMRRRLAQLVVVGVDPSNARAAADLVRAEQVGGIFIGGNATALLRDNALGAVQEAATVPVSVAVDEEGGRVQRIDALDGDIPSARKMARTLSPDEVKAVGAERGRALRARGVTVDYAPDVDVTEQPDGAVIGDRSFSPDPEVVRAYAFAFAEGLREAGIQPVFKHFPGHGHASGDSHQGAVVSPPLATLRRDDLVPYQAIAEFDGAAVMVGHIAVPGLTAGKPASLAEPAYRLLRTDYHFDGPVITDDLGAMRAISARYPLPTAVVQALAAGADQALWSSGGHVAEVLDRLEKAAATGELPGDRIHEALLRVLTAKQAC